MPEQRSVDSLDIEIDDLVEEQDDSARSTRGTTTRESELRSKPWSPAPLLPNPDPREGLDFRYVRIGYRESADSLNLSQALRDGWEPVKATEYPELAANVINDPNRRFPDNVEFGGLLLCARPVYIGEQMKQIGKKEMNDQIEAVDRNWMREQHPGMAKQVIERNTRVSKFGD